MDIRTIYEMVTLSGTGSPREYHAKGRQHSQLTVKPTKRRTFIEDVQKLSKLYPGPGKYVINPENKKNAKSCRKLDFAEESKKPGTRYIDKLLKDKKKIPAVGSYKLEADHTEQLKQKYKAQGDRARKVAPLFKPSQFEETQVDCINVGPGYYNTERPFGQKKSYRQQTRNNQLDDVKDSKDKDKKDKDKDNDKSKSLPKLPGCQTYTPIPQNYSTFDSMASQSSMYQGSTTTFTKANRSKSTQGVMGPGPKYSLISQWSPKHDIRAKNLFQSVSVKRTAGVYH